MFIPFSLKTKSLEEGKDNKNSANCKGERKSTQQVLGGVNKK